MIHLLATFSSVLSPVLADVIWIGGGTLGLIVLIVIIVLVLRR
jgi:hypothetical protein